MGYWLADFEVEGFRTLLSLGAHWEKRAFFEENYYDVDYGALDTSKLELTFDPQEATLPVADFVWGIGILTCPKDLYDRVFRYLLDPYVKRFLLKIDGVNYVAFRPIEFLDLIDLEKSKYREREGREPYAFARVALRKAPDPSIPIFSCSWPTSTRYQPIVSHDFKRAYDENELTGLRFVRAYPL